MRQEMATLIPVLGDQLSFSLSSLADADPVSSILLVMEVAEETRYVHHHKKKLAYILSAMRHHVEALRTAGWTVDHVKLDDPENSGSFTGEIARALTRHPIGRIVVTHAGEWRVQAMIDMWAERFGVPVEIRPDSRFVAPAGFFEAWASDRKQLRMEFFYREMRRHTGLLMNGDAPEGGQWNYDRDNRKPAGGSLPTPAIASFPPDAITTEVLALVERRFPDHPGTLDGFSFAVTFEQAAEAADHFFRHALPAFGDYQDAMLSGEPLLWHSLLSPYLNSGLLDPLVLCRRAEAEYRSQRAPLNAVEGFIRQIIGWREYVRGLYWWIGPDYGKRNFLNARRSLPSFYWTGETEMKCLREAIGQTLELAYAHHIQRLMITGNFALLIGADPDAVHRWYLEVYADAYEWVELPNTLGMSQFADGGLLASKPYASSGAYIDRMSNYCGACRYDVKQRIGPQACPFNALYWDFLSRNRDKLGNNQRLAMPYRNWDRMDDTARSALKKQAREFLQTLDESNRGQ
jgi:deoxyribodipyrimidine photolyase-related protein